MKTIFKKLIKPYSYIIALVVLVVVIVPACNKNSDPAPKDYTSSISDKTWSGALTYVGDSTQYYTILFYADKSLIWTQNSGDYPGNWELTGNKLKMSFTGSNAVIKAGITNDDKLENIIVENTNAYKVNSCSRIETPEMALDNTNWSGTLYTGISIAPYQMSFLTGNMVRVKIGGSTYSSTSYTRSASGAAISFNAFLTTRAFVVIMSTNEMKGCIGGSTYPMRSKKQ